MNTISMLKTLPLVGILALSLGLTPVVTMADDERRGRDHVYKKHDGGKHHYREHRRLNRDHDRSRHGHHKSHKHGHKHNSHRHHEHKHHRHDHHGHSHHGHKHYGRGHRHVDRVIVHNYYDDWDDYDRFRLLLGLHFDNIDLIYRGY